MIQPQCALVVVLALASSAARAESDGYVESIAFEEVLPNEPDEWAVRVSVAARSGVLIPQAQLFFGIIPRLGGELSIPSIVRTDQEVTWELGDVGAGLKLVVMYGDGAVPTVAVMVEATAPTGDEMRELGAGHTEIEGGVGLASVSRLGIIQGAFGYASSVKGTDRALGSDLSFALPLPHDIYAFVESRYTFELDDEAHRWSAGPGLKYQVASSVFVAVSAMFGLTQDTPAQLIIQVQRGI
jgi:Putative MetA-pathway of phenol degradation